MGEETIAEVTAELKHRFPHSLYLKGLALCTAKHTWSADQKIP